MQLKYLWGFLGFIMLLVIGLIIYYSVKNKNEPKKFCPFPSDPNFRKDGCKDASSANACKGSVNEKYVVDEKMCMYRDPNACAGNSRAFHCNCTSDSQCGSGLKCRYKLCTNLPL